jgi:septal ring factor EnvC (AmiA/AmiB activator)
MDAKTTTVATAVALAGLQIALFAWLKTDIGALSERLITVERNVARVESNVARVESEVSRVESEVMSIKTSIATLSERVAHVENEVAFVRGQLSLALPALAQTERSSATETAGVD